MQSDISPQIGKKLFWNLKLDELFHLSLTLFREVTHRPAQMYVPGTDTSFERVNQKKLNGVCIQFTSRSKEPHSCLKPSSKFIKVTDIKCRTSFPLWIRLWKNVPRDTNFVPREQVPAFLLVYLFRKEGAAEVTLITELAKMKQKLTNSQPWGLKYLSYLQGRHRGDNSNLRFSISSQPQPPFPPFHTKR